MPTDEKFEDFVNETMEKIYRTVIGGLSDSILKVSTAGQDNIDDEDTLILYNMVVGKLQEFFATVAMDDGVVASTSKLMAAVLKEEIDSTYAVKFGAEAETH